MHPPEAHNPVLKAARLEVAPQIPNLAPQLPEDPTVVRAALCQKIGELGVDPAEIADNNLNKTERHTFASFLAAEQKAVITTGSGQTARYKNVGGILTQSGEGAQAKTNSLLEFGMGTIRDRYTEGSDAAHTWWPHADERYQALSFQLRPRAEFTIEGGSLKQALTSENLGDTVVSRYVGFINRQGKELSPLERIRAAHDIAYLAISQAGMYIKNFQGSSGLNTLAVEIVFDQARQKYGIKRHPEDNWNKVYSRDATNAGGDLLENRTVTMQCPYHTATDGSVDTTLESFVHASIDLAAREGDFGQVTGWRGELQKAAAKLQNASGRSMLPPLKEVSSVTPSIRDAAVKHAQAAGRTDLVAWLNDGTIPENRRSSDFEFIDEALRHAFHLSHPDTAKESKLIFKWDTGDKAEGIATDVRLLTTGATELGEPTETYTYPEDASYKAHTWRYRTIFGSVIQETNDGYLQTMRVYSANSKKARELTDATLTKQSSA